MIKFYGNSQQDKEPIFAITAPPRVGARWFCQATKSVGFCELNKVQIELPDVSIAIVRHPYEWLKSIYYHSLFADQEPKSANKKLELIRALAKQSPNFVTFVELVSAIENLVTKMFDFYRGMSVVRLEDFPWAPIEFFQAVKELSVEQVASVKSLIATNKNDTKPRFSKQTEDRLRKMVVKAEQEFCERYNYF